MCKGVFTQVIEKDCNFLQKLWDKEHLRLYVNWYFRQATMSTWTDLCGSHFKIARFIKGKKYGALQNGRF